MILDGRIRAPGLGFRTLTLLSSKGGTGKTTLAVQLAVIAAGLGLEPVLLDCDPQRSASDWSSVRGLPKPQVIRVQPQMMKELHFRLRQSEVKLLIIDTPPSGGPETTDALSLSDLSLIVCRPSAFDVWAVGRAAQLASQLSFRSEFVINQAPAKRSGRESATVLEAAETLRRYGVSVAPIGLRTRVDYSNAVKTGRSVTETAPESVAAKELLHLWSHVDEMLWGGRAATQHPVRGEGERMRPMGL